MSYRAEVVADSISLENRRLTTMLVTFPRFLAPEFNTHRVFSRNAQSSRARPLRKTIRDVLREPFIPEYWGAEQSGMSARATVSPARASVARRAWLAGSYVAVAIAVLFRVLGVHKQVSNRILEPWMWHTVLVSSTTWSNFLALRDHEDAQPEMRELAQRMRAALEESLPVLLVDGMWHLPLVSDEERAGIITDRDWSFWRKVSVGRCARTSYLTHDGKRDPLKDVGLHDRLLESRHLSPFEHVATPCHWLDSWSNFEGWKQAREDIPHQDDASLAVA